MEIISFFGKRNRKHYRQSYNFHTWYEYKNLWNNRIFNFYFIWLWIEGTFQDMYVNLKNMKLEKADLFEVLKIIHKKNGV